MGFRDSVATWFLNTARTIGEKLGCRMAVDVDGNRLKTKMEVPDTDRRAWDTSFYEKSGLFVKGYANPVKPVVQQTPDPKEPDDIDVDVSDNGDDDEDGRTYDIIPSYRYRHHQDQHVISELVNPTEQWKLIVYGIIGLGILMFVNVIVVLYATGSFA